MMTTIRFHYQDYTSPGRSIFRDQEGAIAWIKISWLKDKDPRNNPIFLTIETGNETLYLPQF